MGRHKITLPNCREGSSTRAVVQGTRGRRGGDIKDEDYEIKTFGGGIIGGSRLLPGQPTPPPHNFQVLLTAQSGSETPGARAGKVRGVQPVIGWSPSYTDFQ